MTKKSVNLLPVYFRTDKNSKFLASTIDQLIKTPALERLNGFVGSKLSKNYNPATDDYINETHPLRSAYQLEPGLVVKTLSQEISKIFGYDDLINQIKFHGGHISNLDRLFRSDFYSYDPHVDWDKLVNFREYFWLPTGPAVVLITGPQRNTTSAYTVGTTSDGNFFLFTPDGLTPDPLLTLYRGVTYIFDVNSKHKFFIKFTSGTGIENLFNNNIQGNGTDNGQIIFTVDSNTPNTLYYGSDTDQIAGGQIVVKTIAEDSSINVEKEIIGKQQFTSGSGIKLVNGLRVSFGGNIFPTGYIDKEFIVEGVGDKIELIDIDKLDTPEIVATQYDVDFDAESFDKFPFDNFKNVPLTPEYITINRASRDRNSWSRYNRWFHRSVIEIAAQANGNEIILPIDSRAKRPIIEFKPNIQLFNYGQIGISSIDLIDNITTDAFSVVEKSSGYFIDDTLLDEGYRVIFNADPDPYVKGRVFEVHFVEIDNKRVISLLETDDHIPVEGSSVVVTRGVENHGTIWWLNSGAWKLGQQKTVINQAPLFDLYDTDGNSYGGSTYTSDFVGTKIFGYAEGLVYDSVLGLNLKYQTGIESSYLFSNYFSTDTLTFVYPDLARTLSTSVGYLKINKEDTIEYTNVWTPAAEYQIPILQFQVVEPVTDRIEINCVDNSYVAYQNNNLEIEVFVNDTKITHTTDYTLEINLQSLYVVLRKSLLDTSQILFKIRTTLTPNSNGNYETPLGLTNNPLNGPISEFTLSELGDHVGTMVDRDPNFIGVFPGLSNINELPFISKYGTRLISNENPISFAHHFISDQDNNIIEAIRLASEQYNQIKLNIIKLIADLGENYSPSEALDITLTTLNENKNITFPYLLSGTVPYGTNKKIRTYIVTDPRNTAYSITSVYNPNIVTNTAILVYLNNEQLVYGRDYTFDQYDTTVHMLVSLVKNDVIVINEFINTDGCYIPPTPTKLGLYPKFIPSKYLDETFAEEPRNVIQGHDGSLLVAFDDYRDDIILEFEKRIFNNIKTDYNPELLDINNVLPGVFRNSEYSYQEIYSIVQGLFLKWTGLYGIDYETNNTYFIDNHKTYNYKSAVDYIFNKTIPGNWRAIYKYYFDTDRPETHPWEMLGFYIKPEWWESEYGPIPYTSGNMRLWQDLELGKIAQGSRAGIDTTYARPGLSQIIPVDENGNIVDPRSWASLGLNDYILDTDQRWSFGDYGPVENAWRRTSNWPFAVQIILALCKPATYSSVLFDTSRIQKNIAGQYTYGTNFEFLSSSKMSLYSNTVDSTIIRSSGYSVYVIEYGTQKNNGYLTNLSQDLTNATFNLINKVGGFVNKDKLSVIIDSVQLGSYNPNPFLPPEDYVVQFDTSNPIETIAISGVIVQKYQSAYVIRGYDRQNLYFKINKPLRQVSDSIISVGDTFESFLTWSSNSYYQKGQIVYYTNVYYSVITNHKTDALFVKSYYKALSSLPKVGGISVIKPTRFESAETIVSYGTRMTSIQEVCDFILGYGRWLEAQGFIFDNYNQDFSQVVNWEFSCQEFLYWSTQNWADNSVITLSPFADVLSFKYSDAVVDNILDNFYEYSLLKADGKIFPSKNFSISRVDGIFTISAVNTLEGFFFARLNLVQKEHVLVFNNKTIFSDIIYDIETGYRQRRIKLKGFKTADWNGDFISPGFIYDTASITDWKPYADYKVGDIVRYVDNYFSAIKKVTGSAQFTFAYWYKLPEKPTPQLLPNFDYKINEFEDFYSLDVDNFDLGQQRMSQHLVGYTPRSYLNNIFPDAISQYKFYQGFIKEKGTRNAITKLEKASLQNLQGKIEFSEEWAFRIGSFGSYSSFEQLEIPLREEEFVESNQIIQLVDSIPADANSLISYITPVDATILPKNYNPAESFPTVEGTFNDNIFILSTAGYVRLDDINYTITDITALLSINNVNSVKEGDTFWLGFAGNGSWDVFRYTRQIPIVTNIATGSESQTIILTTDRNHGLHTGDIIGITRFEDTVNGIYYVTKVNALNKFTVKSTVVNVPTTFNSGVLFKFISTRFKTFDDITAFPTIADVSLNELFWVDEDVNGKWAVYKKIENYDKVEFTAPNSNINQQYGSKFSKQHGNNTVLVTAPTYKDLTIGYGKIYIYTKVEGTLVPLVNYTLNEFVNEYFNIYKALADTASFGDTIIHDETDDLVFASSPDASKVRVDTTGSIRYAKGANAESSRAFEGLLKISGIDRIRPYSEIPYAVLVNPVPQNKAEFSKGLFVSRTTSTKTLLVGTPGQNTSTGVVYRYTVDITTGTKSYLNVASTCTVGQDAKFDISRSDVTYTVTGIVNSGTNYNTSSQIIIYGNQLGGAHPRNDLIIRVASTGTNGSILSYTTTGTSAHRVFDITTGTQLTLPISNLATKSRFGNKIVGNKEGTLIAVASPGYADEKGAVFVYQLVNNNYSLIQTIDSTTDEYKNLIRAGDKLSSEICMNELGTYLFISSTTVNDGYTRFGKVYAYKWNGTEFKFLQILHNPSREPLLNFGYAVSINAAADILSITSQGTNQFNNITFDDGVTTFDAQACIFGELKPESGTAYVYNRYNEKFILAQEMFDSTVDSGSHYGKSVLVDDNEILVGSPGSLVSGYPNGSVYIWNEIIPELNTWAVYRQQEDLVDTFKIKNASTIDSFKEEVVDYLDIIDPLKGRIPGLADQEIRYKTSFDPAVYEIGTNEVVIDISSKWSSTQVGELWWDLSTVKYVWYEQGEPAYRKNTWGKIFPGSSIDIYEWVESAYLPSQWAAIADTNEGLTQGISGQPRFSDDTVYSTRSVFNPNNNSFEVSYYFWVKGKTIVPRAQDRRITAQEVATLIENPKSYGLKYLSIISKDSLVVTNFKSNLIGERIYLNVSSDTINNNINKHTEWLLVEENSENSFPNEYIERKLFDSLLGKDSLGNLVPDPVLPARLRYGVEVRPRQTMFVDRTAALRNAFDFVNTTLEGKLITGIVNFDILNSKDPVPDVLLGEYDQLVEDIEGRDVILTKKLKKAQLSCDVLNGKIVSVEIINPGFGYKIAPSVSIINNNEARIKTSIDENGQVISAEIIEPGYGFVTPPLLLVRPYTVIVLADISFPGKWTQYSWSGVTWDRIHTQRFDTTRYWKYIDWKAETFNELKPVFATVDELYQLDTLNSTLGDYIKVKNAGDNRYITLEKIDSSVEVGTFDKNYNIVYSENGTIQILDSIWNTSSAQLGFDEVATFDQTLYSETSEVELANILKTIREDIFTGTLRLYWNQLFFKCVKYAITEQRFLDWAFKTSFINVRNIAGVLDQRTTYRFQDSQWYEDYLNEVKPFRTKIRNYQLNYQIGKLNKAFEETKTYNTDFDLPVSYDPANKVFEVINIDNDKINQYPYKSWLDNYTCGVENIILSSHGAGYRTVPVIEIIPAFGDTGSGATAKAYIGLGKITEIEITNVGTGYTKTPTLLINGGGDGELVPAVAYAQLGNNKVRSNFIGIKFDRISVNTSTYSITSNTFTDDIIATGSDFVYQLTWNSTVDKNYITVKLDGILVLHTDYEILSEVDTSFGYHKRISKISLADIPKKGQVITVIYSKNINLYSASERIRDYYNPGYGMPGNELAQLMSGAEYPGVKIETVPFSDSAGWDALPFFDSAWDSNVVTSKVETVLTRFVNASINTASVASVTGMTVGQTIVVRDVLPIPTAIAAINLSTGTYSSLTATSVATYIVTASGVTTYVALTATWTTATSFNTGTGAIFTIARQDFTNGYVASIVNSGQDYDEGTELTITGNRLGGITPENDLIIRVVGTGGIGEISTFVIDQGVTSVTSGTVFQVNRYNADYDVIALTTGTGYTTSTAFTINGNLLGGTPDNDIILQVTDITKIADKITPNGITPSVSTSTVNAYNNLQINRAYIQAEAVEYFEVNKPSEFVYDQAIWYRDVGFIIDSISYDLLYGGNLQAIESGLYYYNFSGGSTTLPGQQAQSVVAYNYIRSILPDIIEGINITSYQAVAQQYIDGPTGSSANFGPAQSKIDIITDIITNGTAVANPREAISLARTINTDIINAATMIHMNRAFIVAEVDAWIADQKLLNIYPFFPNFTYDTRRFNRDVGLIVDAIVQDLLMEEETQSTFVGIQYWSQTSYVDAFATQALLTIRTLNNYVSGLAQKIVANDSTGTRYQSIVNQNTTTYLPATITEQSFIANEFSLITYILGSGGKIGGEIISYTSTGTALAGVNARFDVTKSNGIYSLQLTNSNTSTGYNSTVDAGSVLLITGDHLGGETPEHNLHITVVSTGTYGTITNVTHTGTASSPIITFDRLPISTTSTGQVVTAYNYITDDTDLDTVIDGGLLAYTNALGSGISDIILDGDAFISPNTSYAPEELLPGQVQESLAINVFTRAEKGSPVIVTQIYPIDTIGTSTTVLLNYRPGNTSSVMISYNNISLYYSDDYTVDVYNKTVTIKPQPVTGQVAITVIGVGGTEILGYRAVAVEGVESATIDTVALYTDVGSAYVTVNGNSISTSTYTLAPISSKNKRARLKVYDLSTGTNLIQSWIFKESYKGYSEVKEQIIIGDGTTTSFNLIQMPGTVGPFHAQAVVEIDGLRALPPNTTYYSIENDQTIFDINEDYTYNPGRFTLTSIEVYVNGTRIRNGIDFFLDQTNNQIIFDPGYLNIGDVMAITALIENDYSIIDGQIRFNSVPLLGSKIKVITYNNHDSSFIRTEVFHAHASRTYKMSRSVLDDSYVWVSINGQILTNKEDYNLADSQTIEIDKDYPFSTTDKIEVMSFSDVTADKSIGFRLFKDILGRTHYKRLSEKHTTYLNTDLTITDTEISVVDASAFPEPNPSKNIPGVILINGERIEYMEKTGNLLGRIKRASLGTGAKDLYPIGTPVTDQGYIQTVPSSGDVLFSTSTTAVNTTTYIINSNYVTFDSEIDPKDQVSVYYGGRLLTKNTTTYHSFDLAYDSNENNSDIVIPAGFTINTGTTCTLTLSFQPQVGVKIKIVKSTGKIWYNQGVDAATNGSSLLYSSTVQAKFLLEQQSGLPDKYQYGQI